MRKFRKVGSRKASTRKSSSRKRVSFGRGRGRRLGGGSGGTRAVTALVNKFAKQALGRPGQGPLDQYVFTGNTRAATIDPDVSDTAVGDLWGNGGLVGNMLTNIRSEAISTLLGGAVLYQPTLIAYGYSTIDLVAAGNSDVTFELVVFTASRGTVAVKTSAQLAADFTAAWAQSYDARPTGFEAFPDTSILQNVKFWRGTNQMMPTKRMVVRVKVGKPKRLFFRFKTRKFNFTEYSTSTFLTEGLSSGKSYSFFIKAHGERGQVCGTKSAVNQPILTELGAPYMMKVRQYYHYRWAAGNNRPTIYGSNLGANESVNEDALSWIGVNALKSQRYNATQDASAGFPQWGAQDVSSKHEAQINPVEDCTGESYLPTVLVGS